MLSLAKNITGIEKQAVQKQERGIAERGIKRISVWVLEDAGTLRSLNVLHISLCGSLTYTWNI